MSVFDSGPDVFVHMHLRLVKTVCMFNVMVHVHILANDLDCVVCITEAPDKIMMADVLVTATCTAAGH